MTANNYLIQKTILDDTSPLLIGEIKDEQSLHDSFRLSREGHSMMQTVSASLDLAEPDLARHLLDN